MGERRGISKGGRLDGKVAGEGISEGGGELRKGGISKEGRG